MIPGGRDGREEHAAVRQSKATTAGSTVPRRSGAPVVAPRTPTRVEAPVGVVHLTAELWPFARTGGLGEAVSGLARCQAAVGMPTAVILPLYRQGRGTTPRLARGGRALTLEIGRAAWRGRREE